MVALLKRNPAYLFLLPVWLLRGKACFKQEVARRISLDVSTLPYREGFLEYLRAQRKAGRKIILATASDMLIALQVADHLKLFDLVLASDGATNLSGSDKRDRLVSEFGKKGFNYAGNDWRDLPVWSSSRRALLINATSRVRSIVAKLVPVETVVPKERKAPIAYLKALRLQHWMKNILLFTPLFAPGKVKSGSFGVLPLQMRGRKTGKICSKLPERKTPEVIDLAG